ncbi:ribonuclease domain-containing protein [Campylobacter concisus]|uniref:ribonuclease domain-containing protein n=1 Tax=Campylobacter concisus TaxID=199 RepID=UPI000CD7F326|nr:ribonuclease domain-containing protein [Campylobacter concisus]QPH87485.1 ribonuclease [Campylobacter concisus]QPI02431.1 ribonuclease [Campylobacter concisus]
MNKRLLPALVAFVIAIIVGTFFFSNNGSEANKNAQILLEQLNKEGQKSQSLAENGSYTSKDEVALYIYKFNKLPKNFITKKEALELGWDAKSGNLWQISGGKSIGGDRFSNREKKLPEADGRKWFECDVNYNGGRRGAERILYSNDGLIYYTPDHYEHFYLLYEKRMQ